MAKTVLYIEVSLFQSVLIEVASSPALSPAFIAWQYEKLYLHEFEKSWGRPGNEARLRGSTVVYYHYTYPVYYQLLSSILSVYYLMLSSILSVYYLMLSSILSVYYLMLSSILSVAIQYTICILSVYYLLLSVYYLLLSSILSVAIQYTICCYPVYSGCRLTFYKLRDKVFKKDKHGRYYRCLMAVLFGIELFV